ncbi:MAG: hypothetical protein OXG69_08645 [bacterium]|nr:hypothetical protein [bacterium]
MLRRRRRRRPVAAEPSRGGARRGARADDAGSGTAIGMLMMLFPLTVVIIAISLLSGSGQFDQALQSTADRAARTAALCCRYAGGPNGAGEVARAALAAAEDAAAWNRIYCNNDFLGDSRVVFLDLGGDLKFFLPSLGDEVPPVYDGKGDPITNYRETEVPLGGTVHIRLTCQVPPDDARLGGFALPVKLRRIVEGVAVIEPYRPRS